MELTQTTKNNCAIVIHHQVCVRRYFNPCNGDAGKRGRKRLDICVRVQYLDNTYK